MMKNGRSRNSIVMVLAVSVLIYLLFSMNKKSQYSIREREYAMIGLAPSAGPTAQAMEAPARNGCGMATAPVLRLPFSHAKLRLRKTLVNLLQKTSSPVKTSLNHASKLVSQKPLVARSATRTSKSAPTHQTPRNHSCGITQLSFQILCNVICARFHLKIRP